MIVKNKINKHLHSFEIYALEHKEGKFQDNTFFKRKVSRCYRDQHILWVAFASDLRNLPPTEHCGETPMTPYHRPYDDPLIKLPKTFFLPLFLSKVMHEFSRYEDVTSNDKIFDKCILKRTNNIKQDEF